MLIPSGRLSVHSLTQNGTMEYILIVLYDSVLGVILPKF